MGVVLPLYAWFYHCRRGFTFVGVVLPLEEWFYLCRQRLTFVGVVLPLWRGISFIVVALLQYAWLLCL